MNASIASGVLHEEATCVIGPGVVCNPFVLLEEMQQLEEGGLKCDHIVISDRAQMLMPYHRYQDQLEEEAANNKIGTTKRGIGPCYAEISMHVVEFIYEFLILKHLKCV